MTPLNAGARLAGHYEIEAPLCRGGMAEVYRAIDLDTRVLVAIKRPLHGKSSLERFALEGEILAALAAVDNAHILRFIGYGSLPDGEPFLVTEWLEGETLGDRLQRGHLALSEAVTLVVTVARALAAVHRLGVVHRDVKPGNIFLRDGAFGKAVLIDFGVARFVDHPSNPLTQTGFIVGTVGYHPTDPFEAARPGASWDVFSLGCVFFECLIGRPPGQAHKFWSVTGFLPA